MKEYLEIILTLFALAIALLSLRFSLRTAEALRALTTIVHEMQDNSVRVADTLRSLTTIVYEMQDKLTGRSHFTELSVYINRSVDPAEDVWHIADTLSADADYYEFYTKAEQRFKRRITIFAPLELDKPVLVGAILRKYLAPEITIKNLLKSARDYLRERFPFKTVVSKTMILVGNQKIGSHIGSAFGHFSARSPNPYAEFVRKIYAKAELEKGETLDEWIQAKCEEAGFPIDPLHSDKLRVFLVSDETIDKYLDKEFNPDHRVGQNDIEKSVRALAKRIVETDPA